MQLGWKWNFSKQKNTLDLVPLKKIVAVSDEYWDALYQPMIDVVIQSLSLFKKQEAKLHSDYVEQFDRLVRNHKGTVQDDPLLVHLYTYSLVMSFSALYVARICSNFDFHAISENKKNFGERSFFYPWMDKPLKSELKISRASRVYPVYIQGVSILNVMLNKNGWKWLHSAPLVLKGLLDAINSNGENGTLSGVLTGMRPAPINNLETSNRAAVNTVSLQEEVADESSKSQSIDDLISDLGGDTKDVSIDELLGEPKSTDSSKGVVDLSIFDAEPVEEETQTPVVEKETQTPVVEKETQTPVNALDEFTAFLETAANSDDSTSEPEDVELSMANGNSEMLYSSESSISTDLVNWCVNSLETQKEVKGIFVISYEGKKVIAIEQSDVALLFVRDDYELETEAAYKTVADEVISDMQMSNCWMPNAEGGDLWKLSIKDIEYEVLLLKCHVPDKVNYLSVEKYTIES